MKTASLLVGLVAVAAFSAGCSSGSPTGAAQSQPATPTGSSTTTSPQTITTPAASTPAKPTKPVATETNPPGDIPDNQAYVAYQPPGARVSVKVPEGWARTTSNATTSFNDKLNRIQVTPSATSTAPTVQSVTASVVPTLKAQVPQFAMGKVTEVSRNAGKVVLVTYQGDSAPDAVTGKVVRDAFEQYIYFRAGRMLSLTLSGPTNADNVDPWKIVSDSVRWL
jgi:cytoskeletal protein RodZ